MVILAADDPFWPLAPGRFFEGDPGGLACIYGVLRWIPGFRRRPVAKPKPMVHMK
jgi:hypothetical protein